MLQTNSQTELKPGSAKSMSFATLDDVLLVVCTATSCFVLLKSICLHYSSLCLLMQGPCSEPSPGLNVLTFFKNSILFCSQGQKEPRLCLCVLLPGQTVARNNTYPALALHLATGAKIYLGLKSFEPKSLKIPMRRG